MKKSCLIIGTLLWGMSAFAQTTIWKRSGWECRISDKGTLEQIVFKGSQRNDTVPFFHDKSNMGPSFYVNMGNGNIKADWIPDGYRSYRATIDGVECRLTYKE